jgi:hypothetical protein
MRTRLYIAAHRLGHHLLVIGPELRALVYG